MHYNYHRYYDPRFGKYISVDPIGLSGGINNFAYSSANPINKLDMYGLMGAFVPIDTYQRAEILRQRLEKWEEIKKEAIRKYDNCEISEASYNRIMQLANSEIKTIRMEILLLANRTGKNIKPSPFSRFPSLFTKN